VVLAVEGLAVIEGGGGGEFDEEKSGGTCLLSRLKVASTGCVQGHEQRWCSIPDRPTINAGLVVAANNPFSTTDVDTMNREVSRYFVPGLGR
jgi:hypothetical protein